ncbi:DUF5691 domain-containing protein [Deinococcus hohokamensis]|uniref:DUF5691 domain-containing protein n=1 Tax=Deinococcus hohokamensis TaxID=309883 RepID=A0ABV9I6N8_9DEIO
MSDFARLLAAALLGTSRSALPVHTGTALAEPLNSLDGTPEEILLARAALAGMVQLAGRSPDTVTRPLPAPAPPESRPEVPPRAARHLPLVTGTPLLAEWLTLCAAAGWRVPPATLPGLLDQARRNTELREVLRPVLGERGPWLAAFNPDWRFAAPVDGAGLAGLTDQESGEWEAATDAAREVMFRTLRASDPPAARALLASTLRAGRTGTRRRLLSVLLASAELNDQRLEPLLEETLDDRNAEVAHLARDLLRTWPRSALNARLAARARALRPGQAAGKPVWPAPPPADAAAARDGLRPEQHQDAPGLLRALLAATHPDALLAALDLRPEGLVALARQAGALDALTGRVVAARHLPTIQVLLREEPPTLDLLRLAPPEWRLGPLRGALAAEQAGEATELLSSLPTPWPADLSAEVLSALRRRLNTAAWPSGWDGSWQRLHALAAQHADPRTPLPPLLPDEAPEYAHRALNELRRVLSLRAQMHADFQPAPQGAAP